MTESLDPRQADAQGLPRHVLAAFARRTKVSAISRSNREMVASNSPSVVTVSRSLAQALAIKMVSCIEL
jgi:hypothetical protein